MSLSPQKMSLPPNIDLDELIPVPEGVPLEFQLIVAAEYARIYNFGNVDSDRYRINRIKKYEYYRYLASRFPQLEFANYIISRVLSTVGQNDIRGRNSFKYRTELDILDKIDTYNADMLCKFDEDHRKAGMIALHKAHGLTSVYPPAEEKLNYPYFAVYDAADAKYGVKNISVSLLLLLLPITKS